MYCSDVHHLLKARQTCVHATQNLAGAFQTTVDVGLRQPESCRSEPNFGRIRPALLRIQGELGRGPKFYRIEPPNLVEAGEDLAEATTIWLATAPDVVAHLSVEPPCCPTRASIWPTRSQHSAPFGRHRLRPCRCTAMVPRAPQRHSGRWQSLLGLTSPEHGPRPGSLRHGMCRERAATIVPIGMAGWGDCCFGPPPRPRKSELLAYPTSVHGR